MAIPKDPSMPDFLKKYAEAHGFATVTHSDVPAG